MVRSLLITAAIFAFSAHAELQHIDTNGKFFSDQYNHVTDFSLTNPIGDPNNTELYVHCSKDGKMLIRVDEPMPKSIYLGGSGDSVLPLHSLSECTARLSQLEKDVKAGKTSVVLDVENKQIKSVQTTAATSLSSADPSGNEGGAGADR